MNKEGKVMRKYSLKLLMCKAIHDCICPIAPPNAPNGYCWNLMEISVRDLTTVIAITVQNAGWCVSNGISAFLTQADFIDCVSDGLYVFCPDNPGNM